MTDFKVVTTAFFKIFFKFCRDRKHYDRDLESSFQPWVLTNICCDIDLLAATQFLALLEFCVATYKYCVATQTVFLSSFCFFSTGILSLFNNYLQNTKLMNIPHFGIKIGLKVLKNGRKMN